MTLTHVDRRFVHLVEAWDRSIRGPSRGGALSIYLRGEKVVDVWKGQCGRDGRPWERDTPCVAYSTTKGVIATAVHMLADRGLVDYDAPIARYWPAFGQNGKEAITVRDLLTHRAGMYDVRNLVHHARDLLDWDDMLGRLERAAPKSDPGARGPRSSYHGITFGFLVGGLIEKISGVRLAEFVRTQIAEPLGLDHFYVATPADARKVAARLMIHPRAAERDFPPRWIPPPLELVRPFFEALLPPGMMDFDVSRDDVMSVPIPSSNGVFTARALAKFYGALARGGEIDGVRLLSRDTLARATVQQVEGRDRVVLVAQEWRLGYHRVRTIGAKAPRAFGHAGYGGTGAWCDPERQLSFAYVRNFGMDAAIQHYDLYRLSGLAIECAS